MRSQVHQHRESLAKVPLQATTWVAAGWSVQGAHKEGLPVAQAPGANAALIHVLRIAFPLLSS